VFGKRVGRKVNLFLCVLPAQSPGESLPVRPGNVLPAAKAAFYCTGKVFAVHGAAVFRPGKVSLATTAALTSEKK
jgi:hypothetical protein